MADFYYLQSTGILFSRDEDSQVSRSTNFHTSEERKNQICGGACVVVVSLVSKIRFKVLRVIWRAHAVI
jgi:hypothetical protein